MTLEEKIRARALTAAVRALIDEAFFPGAADPGHDRYVVYDLDEVPTRVSSGRDTLQSGQATLTLHCYGRTKRDAIDLRNALKVALDGWRDVDTVPRVSSCHLERKTAAYVPPEDGSQTGYFNEPMRFLLWYSEA